MMVKLYVFWVQSFIYLKILKKVVNVDSRKIVMNVVGIFIGL